MSENTTNLTSTVTGQVTKKDPADEDQDLEYQQVILEVVALNVVRMEDDTSGLEVTAIEPESEAMVMVLSWSPNLTDAPNVGDLIEVLFRPVSLRSTAAGG